MSNVIPQNVVIVPTLAAFQSTNVSSYANGGAQIAYLQGTSTEFDGGQGFYQRIDGDFSSASNPPTLIVDQAGNRWQLTSIVTAAQIAAALAATPLPYTSGGTGSDSNAASSAASSVVWRNSNQNAFANNFISKSTNVVSAGGTTTLTGASARHQNLTGSANQTFKLPDATTLQVGAQFQFNNNSTGVISIVDNGSNAIATIPADGAGFALTTSIATADGDWDAHTFLPHGAQWGSSGIVGTTTNDNAGAGCIGQLIESTVLVGAAVALTTATAADITSISLTAGDWDVWANVLWVTDPTSIVTELTAAINTTTATLPTAPAGGAYATVIPSAAGVAGAATSLFAQRRLSLAATTTVYLVAQSAFTVSTQAAYGYLGARRRR